MLLFSCKVMSDTLQPHGLQLIRLPCLSLSPGIRSHSYPSSWWCHLTIQPSHPVTPFSSCLNLPQHQGLLQWVGSEILRVSIYYWEYLFKILRVPILKYFLFSLLESKNFYICGCLANYHFPGYFNRIKIYAFNNYLKVG